MTVKGNEKRRGSFTGGVTNLLSSTVNVTVGTYGTFTRFVKPICPNFVSSRWEHVEAKMNYYLQLSNQGYNHTTGFLIGLQDARNESRVFDYILAVPENAFGFEQLDKASYGSRSYRIFEAVYCKSSGVIKPKCPGVAIKLWETVEDTVKAKEPTIMDASNTVTKVVSELNTARKDGQLINNVLSKAESALDLEVSPDSYKMVRGARLYKGAAMKSVEMGIASVNSILSTAENALDLEVSPDSYKIVRGVRLYKGAVSKTIQTGLSYLKRFY